MSDLNVSVNKVKVWERACVQKCLFSEIFCRNLRTKKPQGKIIINV